MKKLLLLILFIIPTYVFSQYTDYNKVDWYGTPQNKLKISYDRYYGVIFSDSIVVISIQPIAGRNDWDIKIENKSAEKIVIKWNAATIGGYSNNTRILFGTMRQFQINDPIPDNTIYPNSSLSKNVIGQEYAENEYLDVVSLKNMKKDFKKYKREQERDANLNIPIEYKNQSYVYHLKLVAKYKK